MTFVGPGAGSYTTETTYKYVGTGGEFTYVSPKRSIFGIVLGSSIFLLLLVIVLIIIFWPRGTTTTPPPVGPPGNCLMWGDPHVETFDHGMPNFYDVGEYWIVNSPAVSIQGRFLATPFTKGLAATHAIIVGGPFMNGHTVQVGPMENGQILVDGQPACQAFPSTCGVDGVVVNYNSEGRLVDAAQGHLEKHIVHIDAPLGVHLQVMRWSNHINVKITMTPRKGGQDGVCGNFNGQATDDTTAAITGRGAALVNPAQCMFHHATPPQPAQQHHCSPAAKREAKELCIRAQPATRNNAELLETCIFDGCVNKRYIAQDAIAESEA